MISVSPAIQVLRWSDRAAGQWLRPARHVMTVGQDLIRTHRHDFHECFWIEEGRGEHHVNGAVQGLAAGDLVFVRASDAHAMQQSGRQPLVWTNVALRSDHERRLRRSYESDLGWWPWRRSGPPHQTLLSRGQLEQLKELVAGLPMHQPRQIDQEGFIVQLLRLLIPPEIAGGRMAPRWLQEALRRTAGDLERLQAGAAGLVESCGRCAEHVNRVVRCHYGMTTTDLLRQLRLEQAARLLRLSDGAIVDIAYDCGFGTLSYFYRCFQEQYGLTPRRFRCQAW